MRARHDALIAGYYDDPEATRRLFRDGWCYTGDHACWTDDGQLIFKGRADDMMIFDGINIYPMEIETCLQQSCPQGSCVVRTWSPSAHPLPTHPRSSSYRPSPGRGRSWPACWSDRRRRER